MEADKLGDVCPACGMPRKAFEPYRERVSLNRLFLLKFDLHPIAIHLSQSLVILIPFLAVFLNINDHFQPEILGSVLIFSIYVFPFTLVLAIITGVVDGITRFKSLNPPLLRVKIIFSLIILSLSIILFNVAPYEHYGKFTIILSVLCLAAAVQLGLWGKKLINVILPGALHLKKKSKESVSKDEA
jgi:hypothetical protein